MSHLLERLLGLVWPARAIARHVHHASEGGGQPLVCVAGHGWYQEWGRPARFLSPGDVVSVPAGAKHWHGAARRSWSQHVAQSVPGKGAHVEWLEPVPDEENDALVER